MFEERAGRLILADWTPREALSVTSSSRAGGERQNKVPPMAPQATYQYTGTAFDPTAQDMRPDLSALESRIIGPSSTFSNGQMRWAITMSRHRDRKPTGPSEYPAEHRSAPERSAESTRASV